MMATNWKVHAIIFSAAACLAVAVYTVYFQESKDSTESSVSSSQSNQELDADVKISEQSDDAVPENKSKSACSLSVDNKSGATLALSSAPKMKQKRQKIPRGVTGAMPKGSAPDIAKSKGPIIGFRKKEVQTPSNIESTDDQEMKVEVTQPPQYQMEELENMDDRALHPRMKHDAPTVGINVEHLSPGLDKQRRRESVQLDEDGEEFKQIQQLREERWKIEDMRKGTENKEDVDNIDDNGNGKNGNDDDDSNATKEEVEEEDHHKELADLDGVWFDGGLSDMKGLSRLQTDPAAQVDAQEQEESAIEQVISDVLVPSAVPDFEIKKQVTIDADEFGRGAISKLPTDPAHTSLPDVIGNVSHSEKKEIVSPQMSVLSGLDNVAFPGSVVEESINVTTSNTLRADVIVNRETTNLYFNV